MILVTVPVALVATAGLAGLYWLVSRVFASEVPPYPNWLRALLFASAPSALGIVPILGGTVGFVYAVVLHVVVIRDLGRISTGSAVLVWLAAIALPVILLVSAAMMYGLAAILRYASDLVGF